MKTWWTLKCERDYWIKRAAGLWAEKRDLQRRLDAELERRI